MSDLDQEFANSLETIGEGKVNFSDDEQTIIDSWIMKLAQPVDTDQEKAIRNEYARTLARLVNDEKQLLPPFTENPPEGELIALSELGEKKKYPFKIKKMPCSVPKRGQGTGAIPKTKKVDRRQPFVSPITNEYEDPQEMAKTVARSKGQSLADFVASISRHTSDSGQGLRQAMKTEVGNFRDYVDNILSRRLEDLTEVLNDEQNRELQRIKGDMRRWQAELCNVKRRIEEIVPHFDIDLYREDGDYLKRLLTVDIPPVSEEDPSLKWKEELCHRLKWIVEATARVVHCNQNTLLEIEQMKKEMLDLEAREVGRRENCAKLIHCEMAKYRQLIAERDVIHREYMQMLENVENPANQ